MRTFLILIVSLLLTYSAIGQNQPDSINYFGRWKIIKYILADAPCALTQKEVDSLIGKEIDIELKYAVIFNDSCNSPVFNVHTENTRRYLYESRLQENTIGIKQASVKVVDIRCAVSPVYANKNSPNFAPELFLISKKELIMDYQ